MDARTWSEWYCLPKGFTWKQIEEKIGSDYPDLKQYFKWVCFFGLFWLIFRNYFLIPFVLEPIGRRAGVREKPYPHPPPNTELELLYKINRARPPRRKLVEATAKIDWTERKVERWLRLKALSMQMTTLEKFCDQGWQLFFYSCFFISGLFVMVPQTFFWNPLESMENLPFQRTPSIVWWYCAIDCGFYVTQTITLFFMDRRSDFRVMFCHHVVTISSHVLCVSMNTINVLSLAVIIHEVADIPLIMGKMLQYADRHRYIDLCAAIFTVVWVCTRLVAYPWMAMRPIGLTPSELVSPALFSFKFFGITLLMLNVYWTFDLINSIRRKLSKPNHSIEDVRSSLEELSEEDEPAGLKNGKCVPGKVRGAISDNGSLRKRNSFPHEIPNSISDE